MNLKIQFNQNLHKLPSSIKTIEDLIKQVYLIYKNKLPKYFNLLYVDSENENVIIQNQEDLEIAIKEFSAKPLKLQIVEEAQPTPLTNQIQKLIQKDDLYKTLSAPISQSVMVISQSGKSCPIEANLKAESCDGSQPPKLSDPTDQIPQKDSDVDIEDLDLVGQIEQSELISTDQAKRAEVDTRPKEGNALQEESKAKPDEQMQEPPENTQAKEILPSSDKSVPQPNPQDFDSVKTEVLKKVKLSESSEQQAEPNQYKGLFCMGDIQEKSAKDQPQNDLQPEKQEIAANNDREEVKASHPQRQEENNMAPQNNKQNDYLLIEKQPQEIYSCIQCEGAGIFEGALCLRCKGTGFITEDDKLVQLITTVLENRLSKIFPSFYEKDIPIHHNTSCNQCAMNPIKGKRYYCQECKISYCELCQKILKHQHPLSIVQNVNPKKQDQGVFQNIGNSIKDYIRNMISSSNPLNAIMDQNQANRPDHQAKQPQNQQPQHQEQEKPKGADQGKGQAQRQYKAKLVNTPSNLITVPPNQEYQWTVVLQNSGNIQWPNLCGFYCISGYLKGIKENINSLKQGQNQSIDIIVSAPQEEETQIIEWRLGYNNQGQIVYFGPKLQYTLTVASGAAKQNQQQKPIICKPIEGDLIKKNQQILEKAQQLKQVYNADMKYLVEFIQNTGLEEMDINELCELYREANCVNKVIQK